MPTTTTNDYRHERQLDDPARCCHLLAPVSVGINGAAEDSLRDSSRNLVSIRLELRARAVNLSADFGPRLFDLFRGILSRRGQHLFATLTSFAMRLLANPVGFLA